MTIWRRREDFPNHLAKSAHLATSRTYAHQRLACLHHPHHKNFTPVSSPPSPTSSAARRRLRVPRRPDDDLLIHPRQSPRPVPPAGPRSPRPSPPPPGARTRTPTRAASPQLATDRHKTTNRVRPVPSHSRAAAFCQRIHQRPPRVSESLRSHRGVGEERVVHLLEVEHVRLVVLAVPEVESGGRGTGVSRRAIDGSDRDLAKSRGGDECPPGSGRLRRGANLRMRDFHSSICFLCVSGVGWILCGGVGS